MSNKMKTAQTKLLLTCLIFLAAFCLYPKEGNASGNWVDVRVSGNTVTVSGNLEKCKDVEMYISHPGASVTGGFNPSAQIAGWSSSSSEMEAVGFWEMDGEFSFSYQIAGNGDVPVSVSLTSDTISSPITAQTTAHFPKAEVKEEKLEEKSETRPVENINTAEASSSETIPAPAEKKPVEVKTYEMYFAEKAKENTSSSVASPVFQETQKENVPKEKQENPAQSPEITAEAEEVLPEESLPEESAESALPEEISEKVTASVNVVPQEKTEEKTNLLRAEAFPWILLVIFASFVTYQKIKEHKKETEK